MIMMRMRSLTLTALAVLMVGVTAFGGRVEDALPSETLTTVTGKAASGRLTTDFTEHLDLKVVSKGGAVTRRHETVFFDSEKDALTKELEQSPNYVSLNGVWDFRYYGSVQEMLAASRAASKAAQEPSQSTVIF